MICISRGCKSFEHQVPPLMVQGDRDEFFPLDIAIGMYRAIPRSALWIIPNDGHIPILGILAPAFQDEALAFLGSDWKQR